MSIVFRCSSSARRVIYRESSSYSGRNNSRIDTGDDSTVCFPLPCLSSYPSHFQLYLSVAVLLASVAFSTPPRLSFIVSDCIWVLHGGSGVRPLSLFPSLTCLCYFANSNKGQETGARQGSQISTSFQSILLFLFVCEILFCFSYKKKQHLFSLDPFPVTTVAVYDGMVLFVFRWL